MSLCIATAGSVLTLLASTFSLSWTHSVEKTEWVEHWAVVDGQLRLTEASVEGSGAGIDLPPDAVWDDGRWTYRPSLRSIPVLRLAASGATVSPWTLCAEGVCREIGAQAGSDVVIWVADPCRMPPG